MFSFVSIENFESEKTTDYGVLIKQLDDDLSPTRSVPGLRVCSMSNNVVVRLLDDRRLIIDSFHGDVHQMSTPLHRTSTSDRIQGEHGQCSCTSIVVTSRSRLESLTIELDRELEHEQRTRRSTSDTKHVTIVEPSARIDERRQSTTATAGRH
jgi:hypothetical protein